MCVLHIFMLEHPMPALRPLLAPLFGSLSLMALLAACDPGTGPVTVESPAMEGSTAPDSALSEPVMEPMVDGAAPAGRHRGSPRRGVVTAGDIDDTLNLAAFRSYVARSAGRLGLPQAGFGAPVVARLVGPDGQPAPGVRYTLRRPGAAEPFHDAWSGVDGRIVVFPAILGAGNLREVDLRAFPDPQGAEATERLTAGTPATISLPKAPGWTPDFLDLVFVLDTTGSMGDELAWLTREMAGLAAAARRAAPRADIRLGLILYRDRGDAYVVQTLGFTGSLARMQGWLRAQTADGGGDYPEAAAAALQAGAGLDWRRGRGERLMIHIADAPPHAGDARAYLAAARTAATKGVQIYGLGASGVAAESEFLMRQAAAMTGGRYVFLTDDSGVGLGHAEPTIACYRVTLLRDLMARILQSELTGRRVEAASDLREVGSYAGGVCRS
jgi:hypothetical protein